MSSTLASGTRATLAYTREAVCNTTPAGVGTPVDPIALVNPSAGEGSGFTDITRASGSFVTDGFVKGQHVTLAGFAATENNITFVVFSVTAGLVVLRDTGDVATSEVAGAGQSATIALQTLRATGRNINLTKNELTSEEVDVDGQENDVRHGFNQVVGSPGYQLSRQDLDDQIEFAFGNQWVDGLGVTGTPTLGATASTLTRGAGDFNADGFRAGDIVRTAGYTNSALNRDWRVTSVASLDLTVLDPDGVLATEANGAGKTLIIPGKRIDVSTTLLTFLVERGFLDVSEFQLYKGVALDELSMDISPEAIINGVLSMLGISAAAIASSSISSIPQVSVSTNSPYAAFDGGIFEGGAEIAVVTALSFTLSRSRSLNPVVGSKFSPAVFEGTARVAGTLTAYFENSTLINKFVDETESTIWVGLDDPNSSTDFFSVVFPRVKYMGGEMDPPQEGPVPLEMPFKALKATGLRGAVGAPLVNTLMTIQVSNPIGA